MIDEPRFNKWHALMVEMVGLNITREKAYLFESRLRPLAYKLGQDLDQIYQTVCDNPSSEVANQVIELMTTHETSFFRDKEPFKLLAHLTQKFLDEHRLIQQPEIRILSAGCSTGEEPYSIAIVMEELLRGQRNFRYKVHACDIAGPTLEKAKAGFYKDVERHVGAARLESFFVQEQGGWRVTKQLQESVQFQQRNLLDLENLGMTFDLIFCRNVAIYFEVEVRALLYEQLTSHLKKHGVLIVGCSEALSGFPLLQRFEGPGGFYYRPKEKALLL